MELLLELEGEITVNLGAENIDGLLGWGLNVGAVAGVSPLGGPQFGVEGNYTQATDTSLEGLGVPISDGDNGGGISAAIPQLGGAIGFLAYADASYTSEIARFSGENALLNAGKELIELITTDITDLNDDQRNSIMQSIQSLQNHLLNMTEQKEE